MSSVAIPSLPGQSSGGVIETYRPCLRQVTLGSYRWFYDSTTYSFSNPMFKLAGVFLWFLPFFLKANIDTTGISMNSDGRERIRSIWWDSWIPPAIHIPSFVTAWLEKKTSDPKPGALWNTEVSRNRGTPSNHPFVDGISHCKPTILDTPIYLKQNMFEMKLRIRKNWMNSWQSEKQTANITEENK